MPDSTMPSNALVLFDKTYTPAALFVPGACDPLIDHIRAEVAKEVFDPSTEDGRKHIKSVAFRVTKSKTAIEAARVALVGDEKKRLAAIDAEGKRIKETLDALIDEIKQPVTDFENREKDRIAKHQAAIDALKSIGHFTDLRGDFYIPDTETISGRLALATRFDTSAFEEFAPIAANIKMQVIEDLTAKFEASRKADADQAELARLRAEQVARDQREREAAIAAQAKAAAEAEAQKREQDAARKAAEDLARVDREKVQAKAAAEKAESDRAAAVEKAELDRIAAAEAAEAAKIRAEAEAKRREEEAAQRERDRIAAVQKQEADETRKREADKAHRAKINGAILTALLTNFSIGTSETVGLTEGVAKLIIGAIAKGQIPHVKISY